MTERVFSYNETGHTMTLHGGWEVVECSASENPEEWPIIAVCENESIAKLLSDVLNKLNEPNQEEQLPL